MKCTLPESLSESIISNIRDAAEKVFDPQSSIGDLDQPKKYDGHQQFGTYQPVKLVPGVEYSELDGGWDRGDERPDVLTRKKGTVVCK